jgi:Cytochrome domain of cellobiose dehydrogenase
MINTPIVLLWKNPSNGEAILSQRQTSTYVMPQVVSSPSRVASALQYKTSATSSATSLSFEIPSTTETRQNIIWAYCVTAPSTPSDPGSSITEHDDMGISQLTLTNTITNGTTDGSDSNSGEDIEDDIPLTNIQKMLLAHGIILTIAFLFVLPFGAIFVRLTRTWIPGRFWFPTHWTFQWLVAGTLITIGFALGVASIEQEGKTHFSDGHRVRKSFYWAIWTMSNEPPLTEMGIGPCSSLCLTMQPRWYYSLHQIEEQTASPSAKLSPCLFGSVYHWWLLLAGKCTTWFSILSQAYHSCRCTMAARRNGQRSDRRRSLRVSPPHSSSGQL